MPEKPPIPIARIIAIDVILLALFAMAYVRVYGGPVKPDPEPEAPYAIESVSSEVIPAEEAAAETPVPEETAEF